MVGRYGTPVWVDRECGKRHLVIEAEVGELVTADAPRTWRVVVPFRDAEAEIPTGTLLRYDQRDYDSSLRHVGWDRFRVLDGPLAGICVTVHVPMPASPVSADLAPVETD